MLWRIRKFKKCSLDMPVTTVGFAVCTAIGVNELIVEPDPSTFSFVLCVSLLLAIAFKGMTARSTILHKLRHGLRASKETEWELYYCYVLSGIGFFGLATFPILADLSDTLKVGGSIVLSSFGALLIKKRKVRSNLI